MRDGLFIGRGRSTLIQTRGFLIVPEALQFKHGPNICRSFRRTSGRSFIEAILADGVEKNGYTKFSTRPWVESQTLCVVVGRATHTHLATHRPIMIYYYKLYKKKSECYFLCEIIKN